MTLACLTSKSVSWSVRFTPSRMASQTSFLERWQTCIPGNGSGSDAAFRGLSWLSQSHTVRHSRRFCLRVSALPFWWARTCLWVWACWATWPCPQKEALHRVSTLRVSTWVWAWAASQLSLMKLSGKSTLDVNERTNSHNLYDYLCLDLNLFSLLLYRWRSCIRIICLISWALAVPMLLVPEPERNATNKAEAKAIMVEEMNA